MNPADLRRHYARAALDESHTDADPIAQFGKWFEEARVAGVVEPNAMTLATADLSGGPSARIVLLKGFDAEGFVFFTDYRSRKGRELEVNPRAALVFLWHELERQVRITGSVEKVSREAAANYFHSRPAGSQLGAWASHQSEVLPSREVLEQRAAELAERHRNGEIPLPPFWGGYRVAPAEIEFWQGRPDRLHDRISYTLTPEQGWSRVRLSP